MLSIYVTERSKERDANIRAHRRTLPQDDPMYLPPPPHVYPHIRRKGGWRNRLKKAYPQVPGQ